VPSNTRTKDDIRRFDGSDYQMVRLTRDNYEEMIHAGLICFHVDAEQAGWLKDEPVFHWGISGQEALFPRRCCRPSRRRNGSRWCYSGPDPARSSET